MVCGIVLRANFLTIHDRTPVPPWPGPGPSYLKSNTIVCLPGSSALTVAGSYAALPAELLQSEQVVGEYRLALDQVESVATEATPDRAIIPSAPPLGGDLGGDGVGPCSQAGSIADREVGHFTW